MRIGIDWGGTKLELIALDDDGNVLVRERVPTPRDYTQSIHAVCRLIKASEKKIETCASIGIGIPGTISSVTGLVKNANSTWLIGKPLKEDLECELGREVRIENDANCFAVSEAVDGAGVGEHVVVGVILGTGCGAGIAVNGQVVSGKNGIAGEFGHVPLPWMTEEEFPGETCWCGQKGCLETWISGTGFRHDFARRTGDKSVLSGEEILRLATPEASRALEAYCDRLARGLALIVNIVDPDVIVLGGGMSNVQALYEPVPTLMKRHVFSDVFDAPVRRAIHGDSSGVRGAAWLW